MEEDQELSLISRLEEEIIIVLAFERQTVLEVSPKNTRIGSDPMEIN